MNQEPRLDEPPPGRDYSPEVIGFVTHVLVVLAILWIVGLFRC